MIQHHNCLYCGKPTDTGFNCGCPESNLTVVYHYVPDIKPLYKQDLISLAKELPAIPHIDHEKIVLRNFERGGWNDVNKYILFVHELHFVLNPPQTLGEKIISFVSKWLTKVRLWIRKHLNNLNATI